MRGLGSILFALSTLTSAGCLDEHALDGEYMAESDHDLGSASDGGASDLDERSAPTVHITNPMNGDTKGTLLPVAFSGWANDTKGAPLTGGALQWTSSLDGAIGSGSAFTRTLSAGTHVITLTATESGGVHGSDEITITVQ